MKNIDDSYLIIECRLSNKMPENFYAIIHIYSLFTSIPDCKHYFKEVKPEIKKKNYYELSFFDYNPIFIATEMEEAKRLGLMPRQGFGILKSSLDKHLHRQHAVEHNKLFISDDTFYWKGYLKNSDILITTIPIKFNQIKNMIENNMEWRPEKIFPEDNNLN